MDLQYHLLSNLEIVLKKKWLENKRMLKKWVENKWIIKKWVENK